MSTDTTTTTTQSEVPIACIPHAVPAEQRERWMIVGTQLYAAVQEVQELPDGYAFRLPTDPEILLLVAEDLNMERLCCPFLRFTLEIEPNSGPFWLRFTGGEGAVEASKHRAKINRWMLKANKKAVGRCPTALMFRPSFELEGSADPQLATRRVFTD